MLIFWLGIFVRARTKIISILLFIKAIYSIYFFLLVSNSYFQQRIFFEIENLSLKFSLKKKFSWW